MEHKATPRTISASKKEKSARKQAKKAASTARRNITDKWYLEHKADFGNLSNYYQITKEVSRGAYGVVYEAFLLNPETKQPTSRKVAIKTFYRSLYPQLILMEMLFLKLVKDAPNIVSLENCYAENNQFFFITDYYENIHFEKIMYPERTLLAPMKDIKSYMYALLEGLASLHELGVVHRDIKQGNFLYNHETKKGILIDFGLAELSPDMKRKVNSNEDMPRRELYDKVIKLQEKVGENKIGTEGFMPLEQVLKKSSQSYGVDIWSAGIILLEFLTSKHTLLKNLRLKREKMDNQKVDNQTLVEYAAGFACSLARIFGKGKVEEICRMSDFDVIFPDDLPEDQTSWFEIVKHVEFDENCADLLTKMLKLRPSERISAKDALLHPFFDDMRRFDNVGGC